MEKDTARDWPLSGCDPLSHAAAEADAHERAANTYSNDADDLLGNTVDSDLASVNNSSALTLALLAVAQSNLGVAFETRALRHQLAGSGELTAIADAISNLQDAVECSGRETGALVQVTDGLGGTIASEFEELRVALCGDQYRQGHLPVLRGA